MSHYCFITGFLRSGTTLVEKLVHSLPGACIGPQPFPFVFHDVKRAFLASLGFSDERYPLGHLFCEARYRPSDFEGFVVGHRISREKLASSFARMEGYSGWKLPALGAQVAGVPEGSLAATYRALCQRLPTILGGTPTVLGTKEVFCEEFLPYFLREGVHVLLVIRDVRDVLTSLKLGGGSTYADRALPALQIVRQWRKSVAFAFELEGHPGFRLVRYEDLVRRPHETLRAVAERLGLDPSAADPDGALRTQDGVRWEGNSSFGPLRGVSSEGVGRFTELLPASWLSFAEALCAPEMEAMGYDVVTRSSDASIEKAFEGVGRELVVSGPGERIAEQIEAEGERQRLLSLGEVHEEDQWPWFIFPRAYRRLARHSSSAH